MSAGGLPARRPASTPMPTALDGRGAHQPTGRLRPNAREKNAMINYSLSNLTISCSRDFPTDTRLLRISSRSWATSCALFLLCGMSFVS